MKTNTSIEHKHMLIIERLGSEDTSIIYDFSKKVKKSLGDFVKAIVLFGSYAKEKKSITYNVYDKQHNKQKYNEQKMLKQDSQSTDYSIDKQINEPTKHKKHDIDILIIIDDINFFVDRSVVESYRIIVEKLIAESKRNIHVTTFRFTSFWEYVRACDPVAINILREGIAIYDVGFFDPLQKLLQQGRIRPSLEAIYAYYNRSPISLQASRNYLLQAVIELYWAVMDAAHAALMKIGEIPPSPEHVAGIMHERMVKTRMVPEKLVLTIEKFYRLMKEITTRRKAFITGKEFDRLFKEAEDFTQFMKRFVY